ncbi:MAG: porphobilinogen synthase [Bacillota bacterium]
MPFPEERPRRLRRSSALRRMVRETELKAADLIYPLFVVNGRGVKKAVPSMPGIHQLSVDKLPAEAKELQALGIPAVLLFGVPDHKDALGSAAWDQAGAVPRAVSALKDRYPELVVITDVCLCAYTDHGHCGIVEKDEILNDPTLELLAKIALCHAAAGADMVAPSDMMDGRVAALRAALDREGHSHVAILSYAVKYASAFYGPFRQAADCAPSFGDRAAYQMDPANGREALREIALDLQEGADLLMVKPALPYLDIVRRVREASPCPLAAYNVSGEYAMIKAAAERGWLDERRAVLEALLSIKRAGADLIITYHAMEAARWLP